MLNISASQMVALQELRLERFMFTCKASLRESHEEARSATDGELEERVGVLLRTFSGFGIGGSGDLLRALHLVFSVPNAVRGRAIPADLLAQLRGAHVPVERKLEALEQLSLFPAG